MLTSLTHQGAVSSLPFDNHLLDCLMDQAHIDVALATGGKLVIVGLFGGRRTLGAAAHPHQGGDNPGQLCRQSPGVTRAR